MKIGFQGLIAFAKLDATAPTRYVAALMKHTGHLAVLSVPTVKFRDKESSLLGTVKGDLTCFDLSGRVLTSLGSGVPTLAIDRVPQSKAGFPEGKTVHGSAKVGAPDGARFSAVFEFPAGDLAINTCFPYEGTFDNTNYACIPRTLLFTAATTAPVTFYLSSLHDTVVVESDALVTITHIRPDNPGGHYHAFENLFTDTITTIHEPKSDSTKPCNAASTKPCDGVQNPEEILSCTTVVSDPDVDCSPVRFP